MISKTRKALTEGSDRKYAVDNCKNKFDIQDVLDSLKNISLVKAYHATINPNHCCCYCFRYRFFDQSQDTLIDGSSPEFVLDYSSNFQKLEDLQPYLFCEIYQERIRKKYNS